MFRPLLPSATRLATTGIGYFLASAIAVALTRFEGGAAYLWLANAVLLASLATCRPARWPALVAICWCGGAFAAGCWGLGWTAAPFMAVANIGEPLIAAGLVTHWRIHRATLDSPRNLGIFLLAAGLIAPAISAAVGALVIDIVTRTGFQTNALRWFVGHALGALTFTPIFAQIAGGEVHRWWKASDRRMIGEAALLLLLVAGTAIGVFAQSTLPLLFLPALPLILITFRVGRIGAAMAVVTIAVAGVMLTAKGLGPVNMIHAGMGERLQFLQFYLAATLLSVLPVAADLSRRATLFDKLRDSEARFRLLTENSTDVVLSIDIDGTIRYASPSIRLFSGYEPESLIGRSSAELIAVEDRAAVRAVHATALAQPRQTFTVEFRAQVPGGEQRWFETHTRAVTDDDGIVRGVVSAVRETSKRRRHEAELSKAANTDALTGLCNRRAFDRELAGLLAGPDLDPGCVAIFDLDHFKQVNDRFGHAVGDAVLRAFAATAGAQVREGDMLARIGGEEFGIVFPGLTLDRAHRVCERIREAVAAQVVQAGDWPVRATVSIGIAPLAPGGDTLERADRALYRSKQAGRNRSSLAA